MTGLKDRAVRKILEESESPSTEVENQDPASLPAENQDEVRPAELPQDSRLKVTLSEYSKSYCTVM